MIEAKELRNGNLVFDNLGGILKIKGINTESDLSHLKPIPITEAWLLKFGFEKTNRIDYGELKPCYAIFSFALMVRHNSYFIDWIGGNTEIKYIHQLQNLYFALTKKELE